MKAIYESDQDAYLHDHRDGLVDIFAGTTILVVGAFMMTELFWMGAVMVPLMLPLLRDAKKRITAPRLNNLEKTTGGLKSANKTIMMMVILGFLVLMLGLILFFLFLGGSELNWLREWVSEYFGLVMGVIGASLLASVAAINGLRRFYLYAVLTLFSFSAMAYFGFHLGIALMALGALILTSGIIILIRFIGEYPVLDS